MGWLTKYDGYYTELELFERGWADSAIRKHLGVPDQCRGPEKLYLFERIAPILIRLEPGMRLRRKLANWIGCSIIACVIGLIYWGWMENDKREYAAKEQNVREVLLKAHGWPNEKALTDDQYEKLEEETQEVLGDQYRDS